ncbi:MAG: hypothetical protein D6698_06005 [Gammaproteobacteria bacterium]|nr:MAG: hypothetical protein D6698_06005 [Gammaproteobacteria bacterium]
MKSLLRPVFILGISVFLTLVMGCASTKINPNHSMIAKLGQASEVYFIRPMTERPQGMGDNVIQVDVDEEPLLFIQKGRYFGVPLRPGNMDIQIRTIARVGHASEFKELVRKDRFRFEPGVRHYILLKVVDGEFRGLSYAPVEISEERALELLPRLKPEGPLAKQLYRPGNKKK